MDYETAKRRCAMRSGIIRTGKPTKIYTEEDCAQNPETLQRILVHDIGKLVPRVFWKNDFTPLDDRVPDEDKLCDDWEEYDPREQPECSAYGEMPA